MLLLAILGCSLPLGSTESAHLVERPQNVPPEATAVHLDATGIRVDGQPVVPADALRSDLVNGIEGDLLDALGASTGPVWLNASPDTPRMLVRKLVVTANEAGRTERWVSGDGTAYGPTRKPRTRFAPTCSEGPVQVDGVARMVSLDLHIGSDGTWVEGSVRFQPRVGDTTVMGLKPACWRQPTCDITPDPSRCTTALTEPTVAPSRLAIGGPIGCLLPIAREPSASAKWPPTLAPILTGLGLTAADEVLLIIEPNVEWRAALAIFEGFDRAKLPVPSLGMPLVEGHESPPLCTAPLRDAASLNAAASTWFGAQIRSVQPMPPPQGDR